MCGLHPRVPVDKSAPVRVLPFTISGRLLRNKRGHLLGTEQVENTTASGLTGNRHMHLQTQQWAQLQHSSPSHTLHDQRPAGGSPRAAEPTLSAVLSVAGLPGSTPRRRPQCTGRPQAWQQRDSFWMLTCCDVHSHRDSPLNQNNHRSDDTRATRWGHQDSTLLGCRSGAEAARRWRRRPAPDAPASPRHCRPSTPPTAL